MTTNNVQVARLITVRYTVALAVIALFVTASFIILDQAIEIQRARSDLIEIAAKQRMSSQRIGFLANALVNTDDDDLRQTYRRELRRIVADMRRRHEVLSLQKGAESIPPRMRSLLHNIFYEGLNPFGPQVETFLENARELLATPESGLNADLPVLLKLNLEGVERILQTHELIVRLLRTTSIEAINRIQTLDALVWLLTLALLAIEVPLIFRPMARQASRTLEQTEAARRKAESEAAAAEAAREGQASFIRTMSHELRTPLNAILGMAQLLRMEGLPPKQDGYANDIHQAGESLLELINGILEFSRLEAKQVTIEESETRLEDELSRTISLFRPLAEKKGLDLSCEIDPKLAEHYWTDGARIHQVLVNLVGNAVKFTEKGSVSVRARYAGPAARSMDLVRFEVKDTGIGVPVDVRDRIFEEFQQADTSLARKYGGSGLGLAISSRIVHLMKGEIGVESEEGAGSLFWFALPLRQMPGAALQADGRAMAAAQAERPRQSGRG